MSRGCGRGGREQEEGGTAGEGRRPGGPGVTLRHRRSAPHAGRSAEPGGTRPPAVATREPRVEGAAAASGRGVRLRRRRAVRGSSVPDPFGAETRGSCKSSTPSFLHRGALQATWDTVENRIPEADSQANRCYEEGVTPTMPSGASVRLALSVGVDFCLWHALRTLPPVFVAARPLSVRVFLSVRASLGLQAISRSVLTHLHDPVQRVY